VLPGEFGPVEVVSGPDRLVARFTIGTVPVTLVLLQPAEGEWAPFHLSVAGRNEVAGGDIVLPGDYLMPGLERFFEMVGTGVAPLGTSDLLRPVELLGAIREATGVAEDA